MLDPKVHEIILQLHVQEQKCMIIKDCVFQYRRNPYKSSNLQAINMKSMKNIESGPQNPKEAIDWIPENQKPMKILQSGTHNHELHESQQIWNPKSRKTHASGLRNM